MERSWEDDGNTIGIHGGFLSHGGSKQKTMVVSILSHGHP